MFGLPALLTDPPFLLFFAAALHVSSKLCPSVRSYARQLEFVPVNGQRIISSRNVGRKHHFEFKAKNTKIVTAPHFLSKSIQNR
jgi:aspartyl/asparaginyl-tRNA synthetase